MKLLNIGSWALGVILLGLAPGQAMGFTLDLFEDTNSNSTELAPGFVFPYDGQQAELNGNNFGGQPFIPPSDTDSGLIEVIGGQRTISVTENPTIGNGGGGGSINLFVDPDDQRVSFNVDSSTNGGASILWDGITETNENLTIDNQNSFVIGIQDIDIVNGVTLNFKITDEFGNSGVISNDVNTRGDSYFLYDNVVQDSVNTSDVSFMDARAIEFYTSNEPDSLDFTFNFIESSNVPFEFSPSLGLIIGGALLGSKLLTRKKRKTV